MTFWWIRLLRHGRPRASSLACIAVLVLLASALDALRPWPLKLIVDHVLRPAPGARWLRELPGASDSNSILILWLAGAGVAIYCISQAVRLVSGYIQTGLGSRIAYDLGAELLQRMQELSLRFHSKRHTGDLVRRVIADSGCVRDLVCGLAIPGAAAITSLLFVFVIMFQMDRMLACIAIIFSLPLGILIQCFSKPMAERSYEQAQSEGELLSLAEQTLSSIPVVQIFRRECEHDRRFVEYCNRTVRAALRVILSQLNFKISTGLVTAIGTAVVMVIGGLHVINGQLTIGSLLVFLAYVSALYAPLETLAYLSMSYATAAASARRVLDVLESDEQLLERSDAHRLAKPSSGAVEIRFENVTFGYEPDQPVLQGIDLRIAAGQVVALVGRTGAGKTTLASLVPRLFDPWSGCMRIAGSDSRDLNLASLREQIAIVPQEPLLLPMSIADNIAYARPGASMQEIQRAACTAGASEFIAALPQGFETIIGERGATLSVGQRQRISIARALLKDSPIVILDEPTSALDTRTEREVVEAMARLLAGRTCLIIAHRFSTIRHADLIVVLESGRIRQTGTHEQLMAAADGEYHKLYLLQMMDARSASEVIA